MIKNFAIIKSQLTELSDILNKFKSEAVQLRIVELVFNKLGEEDFKEDLEDQDDETKVKTSHQKKSSQGKAAAPKSKGAKSKGRSAKGSRPGPKNMIEGLIAKNFFKKPKTISDIINHCTKDLAYTYSNNELAITLTRLTRDQQLKREKNAEDQFEYTNK